MSYYYLDQERKSHGPHSLEELSAMLASGKLSPETLVARAGDARWKPLGVALSEPPPPPPPSPCSSPADRANCCPRCRKELSPADGNLPEKCPSCGYILRPANSGFWAYALLPLRKYCDFKGRARRREFWFFYLFYMLLSIAGGFLLGAGAVFAEAESESVIGYALIGLAMLFLVVLSLGAFLPWISVSVRRLHDVGFSGKWLLLPLAANLVYGGLIGYGSVFAVHTIEKMPSSLCCSIVDGERQPATASSTVAEEKTEGMQAPQILADGEDEASRKLAARLSEIEAAAVDASSDSSSDCAKVHLSLKDFFSSEGGSAIFILALLVSYFVSLVSGLAIFVICLLNGNKGSNKYGPSPKYPLS